MMGHNTPWHSRPAGQTGAKPDPEKIDRTGEDGSGKREEEVDVKTRAEVKIQMGLPEHETEKLEETVPRPSVKPEAGVKIEVKVPKHETREDGEGKAEGREKRRPRNVTVPPCTKGKQTSTYYMSSSVMDVIDAAETYIRPYVYYSPSPILKADSDSEADFDAVIQYLSSMRHSASLLTPSTPHQPTSPNSPRTPIHQTPLEPPPPQAGLSRELVHVYKACQAYVDVYVANNPPSHITATVIANLHLDILKWRNEFLTYKHGNTFLHSMRMRSENTLLRILLERTFKGLAKYYPFLRKNVELVDGQAVHTTDGLGVEGFEVVKGAVRRWMKKLLPDIDEPSLKLDIPELSKKTQSWMKIGLTALLVTTLWVSLYSLLMFVTPIVWRYAFPNSNHNLHHHPHQPSLSNSPGLHIPGLNINVPPPSHLFPTTTHNFETKLQSFEKNLNATEKYYQKATDHAGAVVDEVLVKTEKLVVDLRHVAFVKFWKGIRVLRPVYWIFGADSHASGDGAMESGKQEAKRLLHVYFEGVENVKKKLDGEKRVLNDTLGKLEKRFNGLVRASGRHRTRSWNPLKSHSRSHQADLHLPKSHEKIKKRYDNQSKLAKEHLFVLYEEMEGFMGKVKGEIEGGEVKGWWLVIGELRKLVKGLRGRVGELGELVKESVERVVWEDEERDAIGQEAERDGGD